MPATPRQNLVTLIVTTALGALIGCGPQQDPASRLYDSSPSAALPGQMGDPPTHRMRGNTSRWHTHRLEVGPPGQAVPVEARWETIDTQGCDEILRVVLVRAGGSAATTIRAQRVARAADTNDCASPLDPSRDRPFQRALVDTSWEVHSGCSDHSAPGPRITLDGSGNVTVTRGPADGTVR